MPRQRVTFQQLWLWNVLQQHAQWRCVAAAVFRLRGALQVPVLSGCFAEISGRHSALRTRIVATDGIVWQKVDEGRAVPFTLFQLTSVPPGQRQAHALLLA